MNTVLEILPIGTLLAIIGLLVKGYNFTQKQAREDESAKNRLDNLEAMNREFKDELKECKTKQEMENRLISEKMDRNSEILNKKMDELKDMIFKYLKDN